MSMGQPLLSIVIPVYRGEYFMDMLVSQLVETCRRISEDFEIILVDDCGPDKSWEKIREHAKKDIRVKGVQLSRNFGQHYAITAGLDCSKGEWIVVMDCDLQDQPAEILKLYAKAQEGYDVVLAGRYNRQDSFFKKAFSSYFYKVLSFLVGTKIDPSVANFGIYKRKVINAVVSMREHTRFFPMLIKWVGFKTCIVEVNHSARAEGKSSYSFKALLNLALSIMLSFSDKPLRLMVKFGIMVSFFAFLFALYNIIQYLRGVISVSGFASLIVSIWFLSGLIISAIGVVGLYTGRIFEQSKQRPIYIINTTENY
jgi:glycosyltransferase involved in cell wall biosynthesis